ncbi:hypothetical protein AVEN_91811-1 [Araneus ventricosus]|uniref:Uncharacterized protein n=1 Tax=Araneus ventricosus TaxID=182803 RepID=A0A4Y2QLI9_ARAVE|nr:hypothetical protein AVEN_91811-1 [Araneus ventricosus]
MPSPSTTQQRKEDLISYVIECLKACDKKFGSSKSGLNKIAQRLNKISSVGQWEKFLHTAGSCIHIRNRSGSTIKVQPTSIARRGPRITKGCKRVPAGRPPTGVASSKKRKHSLSSNINLPQPNAKLHGSGH